MPASVPGSFIRPERAPGQRIGPAFCVQAPPPAIRVSPMAAPLFGQRFHPAGLNALATGGAIQPALSFAWAHLGPVLIKIGFGRRRATLVIAIGVERGQNSLVTIARQPPTQCQRARNPLGFPPTSLPPHARGVPSGKPWRARLCAETGRELPRPGARPATQRAASF